MRLSVRQAQGVWVDLRLGGYDSGRIVCRGRNGYLSTDPPYVAATVAYGADYAGIQVAQHYSSARVCFVSQSVEVFSTRDGA